MKETNNPFKIDDILVTSGGYSMTLVKFYQVRKITPKMIYVQEIGNKYIDEEKDGSRKCVPDVYTVYGGFNRYKINFHEFGNPVVYIEHKIARKWNGEKMYYNDFD
jgi:hypothetical protein